jgi:DNA (cytosine-5)-methyltransferase 1
MVAAGIRPVLSVEHDPVKTGLSSALARNNHLNFKPYGGKIIPQTVEEIAQAGFPDFPRNLDYLHASPVCSNFSLASKGKKEQRILMPRLQQLKQLDIFSPSASL